MNGNSGVVKGGAFRTICKCKDSPESIWMLLLTSFLLISICHIHAQSPTDYTIQANIIYRFTKYVDWPGSKKTGDFVIGVVGSQLLVDELKTFTSNKLAGHQKIVVKTFSASAEVYPCHILFISEEESNSLKKIAVRTAGDAVLLVSESDGLASKGSCINFVVVNEHLKLEINKNNIEKRNMGIASELLQLGIIVK